MSNIINRVFIEDNGRIISTISGIPEILDLNKISDKYIDVDALPNLDQYWSGSEWLDIPPQPSSHHIFDYGLKDWIDTRTLDEIKAQKWDEIKSQRDQLEFGGFEFEGYIYDSDQVSQGRIMGAASAGIGQTWTLADNTTVALTASQLQQLYTALQTHIASVHERGRIARQLIYEAETREEVEAIQL